MRRVLFVVIVCSAGFMACGSERVEPTEALGSSQQGLACETGTGYCPGTTVCAYPEEGGEGLCRPACINGNCATQSQTCCPNHQGGAPYCTYGRCL